MSDGKGCCADSGWYGKECDCEAQKSSESAVLAGSTKKPPLGLMPEYVWKEKRVLEILEAIDRYFREEMKIPKQWYDELGRLINVK